jgi:hypothetical protein
MVMKKSAPGPKRETGAMTLKFSRLSYCVNRKNRLPTLLDTVALLLTTEPR